MTQKVGSSQPPRKSYWRSYCLYFYNVSAGEREFAGASVWEDGDEEMGPVTGLVYRGVPREGSQKSSGDEIECHNFNDGRKARGFEGA